MLSKVWGMYELKSTYTISGVHIISTINRTKLVVVKVHIAHKILWMYSNTYTSSYCVVLRLQNSKKAKIDKIIVKIVL